MLHSILIVEDEKIVREGLARALSRYYKTYKAVNDKEAVEILKKNKDIRVVISDQNPLILINFKKRYKMPFRVRQMMSNFNIKGGLS
jgi:DNA-binding NarL/FixJ family response regulator